MQKIKATFLLLSLLVCTGNLAMGQGTNGKLITGKWKFAKATRSWGSTEKDYQYNGDPVLTFEKSGRYTVEDPNPNYRQRGTWKIENDNLVRDPDKTPTRDVPSYSRKIKKITSTELVIADPKSELAFYFTKLK